MCLEGTWAPSPCSMEPKHHFGTAQNITTFVHLTILRHQNTKTAAYQISKNDWVRPIILFFGFAREKSFVTVAFDRPVVRAFAQNLIDFIKIGSVIVNWNFS